MSIESYQHVDFVNKEILDNFPYFSQTIPRQYEEFGVEWAESFERHLKIFFSSDFEALEMAVKGYCKFALDSMKLQIKFQKTKEYDNKSYDEAAAEVYQDRNYMFGLYLPGILLSHFLWRHHYKQKIFFDDELIPLLQRKQSKIFFDVGVGTGYYSNEFLRLDDMIGTGFDMSPYSLEHASIMAKRFGVFEKYSTELRDIINDPVREQCDVVCSIEVLEHLEEPQLFLNSLYSMLKDGGVGFISAAINAPNADHIYLYRSWEEVAEQIVGAGFKISGKTVDDAYDARKKDEVVPVNAAFIVEK